MSICGGRVVQLKEVRSVHVVGIEVECCRSPVLVVVLDRQEENSIVLAFFADLLLELGCPKVGVPGPGTRPGFARPWVSQLDEFDAIGKDGVAKKGISVTTVASGHDVVGFVVLHDHVPELLWSPVAVAKLKLRGTSEGSDGCAGVTTVDVLVVAVVLGKCLLEQHSPERVVVLAGSGELSSPAGGAILDERNVVVDDDGHGNTEGVEVEGINTVLVQRGVLVAEDLFEATWLFRD